MTQDNRSEQLLSEILEVQRAQLEEYKRVTAESLQLQRRAVASQTGYLRLLRPILIAGAVLVAGLVAYLLWLSRFVR